MRGKGEGGVYRVPADRSKPLQYWTGTVELTPREGKRRKVTVRRKDKAELLDELDRVRAQLKERGDLPTANQTVEQWMTYWFEQIATKELRPKTAAGYRSVVFGHIIPAIGPVKLNKLTPAHVRRVHDRITDEKQLSSTYALNAHNIMSTAFEAALREGRIGRNPTKLTNAPRKANKPQEAFEVDEAVLVLEHVSRDEKMGARWATGLLSGARRGEVIGLELDRVTDELDLSWQLQRLKLTKDTGKPDVPADFEYRHLTGGLYLTRPKSDSGWRIIPLVDPLKSILERHIESAPPNPYGLVFTRGAMDTRGRPIEGDQRPIDPDQDTALWKTVLKETGIEREVVLHGLRHTTADLLYLAGVPEDLIQEILGHSSRSTTRGYKSRGKVNQMRLNAAMTQFSALLTRRDDGRPETSALAG